MTSRDLQLEIYVNLPGCSVPGRNTPTPTGGGSTDHLMEVVNLARQRLECESPTPSSPGSLIEGLRKVERWVQDHDVPISPCPTLISALVHRSGR